MKEKIVKIFKNNRTLVLMLIPLVIIAAIISSNILSFINIEKVITNQVKDTQLIETKFAANNIENHIIQVKDELTTLSKFPLMETLDINKCTGDMKIVHADISGKINSLLRADKNGNVIECSSEQFSNYLGLNIKNKDYFKIPEETNEPYIAGMIRQGANQQIIISAPLFETAEYTPYPNFKGQFNGILMSIIELNYLYNLYLHPYLDLDKNHFLLINLDTEETILKDDNIEEYALIKQKLPKTDNGFDTIADFMDFGDTIITSSDLILGQETWRLIVLTPIESIKENFSSIQNRHFFSLIFVVVIIISVFFFLTYVYRSKEEVQSKLDKANITLESLGIDIGFEKDKFNQSDIVLESKNIYLIKEDEENHAHELFISTLNRGFAGLGIVREDPRKIKKKYNLEKTSFIWLTNTKVDNIPYETNIDNLYALIEEFIKKSNKSVILIDRLDYILSKNKFEDIMDKISSLKDLASAYETILIISANPELIEGSQLKAIEAETIDLYGKHLRKKVELSDVEMNILNFVNENNITNRLVSYKDITNNFKITKPTTRSKINKLQRLGLLNVEQKGRFKSLKITSAGRRIMG